MKTQEIFVCLERLPQESVKKEIYNHFHDTMATKMNDSNADVAHAISRTAPFSCRSFVKLNL